MRSKCTRQCLEYIPDKKKNCGGEHLTLKHLSLFLYCEHYAGSKTNVIGHLNFYVFTKIKIYIAHPRGGYRIVQLVSGTHSNTSLIGWQHFHCVETHSNLILIGYSCHKLLLETNHFKSWIHPSTRAITFETYYELLTVLTLTIDSGKQGLTFSSATFSWKCINAKEQMKSGHRYIFFL